MRLLSGMSSSPTCLATIAVYFDWQIDSNPTRDDREFSIHRIDRTCNEHSGLTVNDGSGHTNSQILAADVEQS